MRDHAAMAVIASVLLVSCSGDGEVAAAPVLKVVNRLDYGATLTLGCHLQPCERAPRRPQFCPGPMSCGRCEDVTLENGGTASLPAWAPLPLPCLMVRVDMTVHCVERSALELIQASGTLAVGPGACGAGCGLAASILGPGNTAPVAYLCLNVCNYG